MHKDNPKNDQDERKKALDKRLDAIEAEMRKE